MNAAEYLAWVRPVAPRGASGAFFLSLPERLLAAAGPGHFLESSASSARGLSRLKLALVAEDEPGALAADARRRDAPGKAEAARELLRALPGDYDRPRAAAVLEALKRWGLRGSLMVSLDYDRVRDGFDKLSFYGYLPGPAALPELLGLFGEEGRAAELAPLAGASLAFFAADLAVGRPAALKLYNRRRLEGAAPDGPAAPAARALGELAPLRDLTRLTRVGSAAAPKDYLGFAAAVPAAALARLKLLGGPSGWLGALAPALAGQNARFVGFDGPDVEVYFDRGGWA